MEAHSSAAAATAAGDGGLTVDDVFAWLLMDDDDDDGDGGTSGGELLNLLDDVKDDESPMVESESTVGRVRFIDDPYSSLMVFQSSSSYITINGNEESCGSSFSDSFTSVMASVDTNGLRTRRRKIVEEDTGAWPSNAEIAREEEDDGTSHMVFDCEWDDEVLATFLGGGGEGDGVLSENH